MNERLTDSQLIELVQQKLPEELTAEEVDALRARLRSSLELQDVLIGQLHLETYLAQALGEFSVSVDEIVRRAAETAPRPRAWWLILGLGATVALLVGIGLMFRGAGEPDAAHVDAGPKRDGTAAGAGAAHVEGNAADVAAGPQPSESDPAEPPQSNNEPWSVVIEAENFDRGNLQVDAGNYGDGIGVIHSGEQIAGFVEYDLDVPRAGLHQIELRYASDQPRPLRLVVNGETIRADAARQDTGDWWPEGQRPAVEARVALRAGRNTILLRTDGLFPHVDKLAVVELREGMPGLRPGIPPTATNGATEGLPILALRTAPPAQVVAKGGNPWDEALDPARPLVLFDEAAFTGLPAAARYEAPVGELKRWLEPVPNQPCRFSEELVSTRRFGLWDGMARLKAPWPRDAVLRLGFFTVEQLQLCFWNGNEGVALRWHPRGDILTWAAYRVRRTDQDPRPVDPILITTDGGAHARTELGVFELRHQAGSLVMTRGDLRLLTVPLPRPPKDVIFDGKARVSLIEMLRGEAAPPLAESGRPAVVHSRDPAELRWVSRLTSPADLDRLADGSLELRTPMMPKKSEPKLVWCAAPLERPGLYEVIVRVAAADAGTGVYLGDAQGNPIHHVGFFRETGSNRTVFGYGWSAYGYERPGDFRTEVKIEAGEPVPWTDGDRWLRIVLGHGGLRLWTSGDGVAWGEVGRVPIRQATGAYSSVGLYAITGEQTRRVRVRELDVRELSALTTLAADETRTRVPLPTLDGLDEAGWRDWVIRTRPADVELATWRRACAIRVLEQNPRPELGTPLLRGLLAESLGLPLAPAQRFAALGEAALIGDVWPAAGALAHLERYGAAAERIEVESERSPRKPGPLPRTTGKDDAGRPVRVTGSGEPYAAAAAAIAAAPLVTEMKLHPATGALVRNGVLRSVFGGRWSEARTLSRRLRHWMRSAHPDHRWQGSDLQKVWLLDWADQLAAQGLAGQLPGDSTGLGPAWRHPVVAQMSREAYNVLSEFESALEGRAWEDACQMISAAGTSGLLGLLPDAREPQLLVSMPRAIALAMRDHPALQATMRERFGKVGQLRVRQAMQEVDVAFLQGATIQYFGTEAAAEAHAWLGDRAVAAGRFAQGIDHYHEAIAGDPSGVGASVAPRLRLASALLGRAPGESPAKSVALGPSTIQPAAFETLLTELRAARPPETVLAVGTIANGARDDLGLNPWTTTLRGRVPGDLGNHPGSGAPADVDWVARQLAVVADARFLYVANRFSLSAWDIAQNRWAWTHTLGGDQGDANGWPLVPMTPSIVGERIFLRRLTKAGPELACLESATGNVVWKKRPDFTLASDPVFARDKLFALLASVPESGLLQFHMATFHPDTGELLSEEALFRLRDLWSQRPPCMVTAVENRIVCSVGASVACCDLQGRVEWLRRQTWLPTPLDPQSHLQSHRPPLVDGRRIYHVQPGAHELACLELDTGRQVWAQPLPGAQRILGVSGERLIVETAAAVAAIERADGRLAWVRHIEDACNASACGDRGIALVVRPPRSDEQRLPMLKWLDPAEGVERGSYPLPALLDPSPSVGPLVSAGGRWWTFFGRKGEPHRELVEMTAATGPAPVPVSSDEWSDWLESVPQKVRTEAALVLPGWTPLVLPVENPSLFVAEFRGETDVLQTRAIKGRGVRWWRRAAIPAGAPKLALRLGHPQGAGWTAVVEADGREIHRLVVDDSTGPQGWVDATVDLSPWAGKSAALSVSLVPNDAAQPVDAYWKRLDVAP